MIAMAFSSASNVDPVGFPLVHRGLEGRSCQGRGWLLASLGWMVTAPAYLNAGAQPGPLGHDHGFMAARSKRVGLEKIDVVAVVWGGHPFVVEAE